MGQGRRRRRQRLSRRAPFKPPQSVHTSHASRAPRDGEGNERALAMLKITQLSVLAALALAAAPARAQTPPVLDEAPASENGRYAMQQTPDGFLRLDTRTGKVSYCAVKEGAARCALAADEREAYEREIASLREAAKGGSKTTALPTPRLPTDDEIDRTLSVMQRIWRGMNRIIGDDPPAPKGGQL